MRFTFPPYAGYLDEFNKNISKVTAAQIKDAFNRRIKPDNFVTVVVGAQ